MGGPRVKWDDASEDLLLEGLKKATAEAHTGDNNFQPSVYHTISATLQEHGYEIDADKVKAQWGRLKTARNNVAHLRGLSGFGWDDSRKVVVATEEVWKRVLYDENSRKVKKFKDYSIWRSKAFPHFKTITELIGGNQAVGDNAFSFQKGSAASPPSLITLPPGPTAPHSIIPPAATTPTSSMEGQSQDIQDLGVLSDGSAAASQDASPAPDSRVNVAATQLVSSTTLSASASQSKWSASPTPVTPVSNKRPKAANTHSQLTVLCQSVGKLVDSITGEPNSPSHGSKFSPVRRKAWKQMKEKEGLSPCSLSWARRVLRSDDCVKEYLSFEDEDAEARVFWLHDEIERVHSQ